MKLFRNLTLSIQRSCTLFFSFAVLVGASILLTSTLFSQTSHAQSAPVLQQRISNDILSGDALGDFVPYEPDSGNIMARDLEFYKSENGQYSAGIWEGQPGTMTMKDMPYASVMYIIEGTAILGTPNDSPIAYRAGEGIVMPKGWNGELEVPEGGVRMIWSTYTNDNLPVSEPHDIILLDRDTLAGLRFNDFKPFDPDVSDIVARDHEFYRTSDDKYGVDVWEAQPGQVHFTDLGYDEMIYILDGNMTFVNEDGDAQIYSSGKALILPKGWSGTGVVSTNGARVILFWHRNTTED